MNRAETTQRPIPVALIAIYFLLAAVYLWVLAGTLIVAPGELSLTLGSRFMHGLELAGPYMMLLFGGGYALIGWGLFRLCNWARWLVMLVIAWQIGLLVPVISAVQFNARFFECGIEIATLAAAGFYLAQAPTALEAFARAPREKSTPRIFSDPHA
jgi:hypothetical protein